GSVIVPTSALFINNRLRHRALQFGSRIDFLATDDARASHGAGLMPVNFANDSILSRCASIAAANSAGVLARTKYARAPSGSATAGSAATARTAAAVRCCRPARQSRG